MYSLIFFWCMLVACYSSSDQTSITIRWQGKRAIGLTIPHRLVKDVPTDSLNHLLAIRLAGQSVGMAGQFQPTDTGLYFEPLVPFTRGRQYAVWLRSSPLQAVTIPALAAGDRPRLLAMYPSADSLPDNLLKVYLHFSRPMREGQSAQYVALLNTHRDTLRDVFLDLQPELWNTDRTTLTLWLDPGRIKRDLQPNKRLGAPLQPGHQYALVVSAAWPDALGASLGQHMTKPFRVIQRDSLSPNPGRWLISSPKPGTSQPLTLVFGEPLDYYLLTETLHVFRADGTAIPGTWHIGRNERQSQFTPATDWTAGRYQLRIDNRLEDLAGNNLSRPFDRDITQDQRPANGSSFREITFEVRK